MSWKMPLKLMLIVVHCFLQGNTMKLMWTYGEKDPVYGHLKWHGTFSGVRSMHMLTPMWKKPNHGSNSRETSQWDVTVKNVGALLYYLSYTEYPFIKCLYKVDSVHRIFF